MVALYNIPYSGKFSWDKIFAKSSISRISLKKFFQMDPFMNFVARDNRCHAILWCEGIEPSVLFAAKMAVNKDVYVIQSNYQREA